MWNIRKLKIPGGQSRVSILDITCQCCHITGAGVGDIYFNKNSWKNPIHSLIIFKHQNMSTDNFGNQIYELDEESKEFYKRVLPKRANHFIQVGPKKYTELRSYKNYAEKMHNFDVWKDDVWVVTLPRSGTTLTQEMVWQICNNLDFETGFKIPLIERYGFFEYPLYIDRQIINNLKEKYSVNEKKLASFHKIFTPEWDKTHDPTQRRFFKTHLAFSRLPKNFLKSGCKIVYTARNPKDEAVSLYHFCKSLSIPVPEKFEDYWSLIEKSLLAYHPYFQHVQEAWDLRHQDNVLFLFYEDIVRDTPSAIRKVAKFFEKELTDEQVAKLSDHLQVENFRKNKSVNEAYGEYFPKYGQFVRKGKIGSWREELFTPELAERADRWIAENYKMTDLRFPSS